MSTFFIGKIYENQVTGFRFVLQLIQFSSSRSI
jgi:hypothetical protein